MALGWKNLLRELEIDSVIFCGIDTSVYVETVSREKFNRGFDVIVISDATASMNPKRYECTLDDVRSFYGLALDTEDYLQNQDLPFISATVSATIAVILINPLQIILWTFRRNEHDVINLYNSLSPVMQLATGGDMLNFGYWDGTLDPLIAQDNLCSLIGRIAELDSARRLVDVGSGLSAPAAYWKSLFDSLDINCVNINFQQLLFAKKATTTVSSSLLNATSTDLPFSDRSVDRVVALESAQHFRPLDRFISESRRVLEPCGLLVIAMPVMSRSHPFYRLGILSWTWSSEHYELEYVKSVIEKNGFEINETRCIGHKVYEPLTRYYVQNRDSVRRRILKKYPAFLESILYRSLLKMDYVSRKEMIDYVIIKSLATKR